MTTINSIIKSNNPLVNDISIEELVTKIDVHNLKSFAYFCRTFNILWNPNIYARVSRKEDSDIAIVTNYMETLENEKQDADEEQTYVDPNEDVWELMSEEWTKVTRHDALLAKVAPIRESFVERCRVKWGPSFNFEEYIRLENTFIGYVKSYDIQDPIKLDAIKKATIMSVQLDRLSQDADFKALKEGYAAYSSILAIADIKSLAGIAKEGEILTVSDLYKYMERNGFEFTFYDQTPRDDVDFAIQNIKDSLRETIKNNTGLVDILQDVHTKYKEAQDDGKEKAAVEELTTEEIEDFYSEQEYEIVKELESQDVLIDDGLEY